MVESPGPVFSNAADRPLESILGIGYSLLVSAEQTAGSYELMKFVVPAGAGAPPHIHHHEDESFYLIDGALDLLVGEHSMDARSGACVHLPRGVQHGFRNTTDSSASFLCWVLPGNLAGFFDAFKRVWPADANQPAPVDQEDIGKMMAAADRYGIEILGGK